MFRTPLWDLENELGANFGEFAGWEMPMSFSSYQEEHLAVRREAAVFDISHMGRLKITGSIKEIENLVAKKIGEAKIGQMIGPTAFLNDRGGFIDDVMVYKLKENEWLIVTNAINREKVINWISKNSSLSVEDLTFKYAMIAVQGRKVWEYIPNINLDKLTFLVNTKYMDFEVFLISRSGWTGEDGVEIWGEPEVIMRILRELINLGIKPAGLIARDSLRLEMGYVLYGEDIDENINPIEARYWVFSIDKEFIGRDAIIAALKDGVNKYRVGFKLRKGERVIPRHGNKVMILDREIGYITSGTFSPLLERSIAMGYVKSSHFLLGYPVVLNIRNRMIEAKIQDFPLI
jgi:aminomethyltransferase